MNKMGQRFEDGTPNGAIPLTILMIKGITSPLYIITFWIIISFTFIHLTCITLLVFNVFSYVMISLGYQTQ